MPGTAARTQASGKAATKPGALPAKSGGKAVSSKSRPKAPAKTGKVPAVTAENAAEVSAANRIQASIRSYLRRKHARQDASRKACMTAEMEQLKQQAWQAQVVFDRKQEAKRAAQLASEAARKRELAALRSKLLEAAFDGETEALERMLEAGETLLTDGVDTLDAHGNSLLSEAAAGGSVETCVVLLKLGADPNSQGAFLRTPLWRAAFLGHQSLITPLLEWGCDPRVPNEGGELPVHAASSAAIRETLGAWDTAQTDSSVAQWRQRREQEQEQAAAAEVQKIQVAEEQRDTSEVDYQRAQKDLKHARQELEKRIYEHDMCVSEKRADNLVAITLQQIKEQESVVAQASVVCKEKANTWEMAKYTLREQLAAQPTSDEAAGRLVKIKELDDVLIKDVGASVSSTGKWPLVIDVSSRASVFLRYIDSNYCNALSFKNMQPNSLRKSLLGSLRYGKPMIIDLMDTSLWGEVHGAFDAIDGGLMDTILSKGILEKVHYMKLVREEDGEQFKDSCFQAARLEAFKFIVLTAVKAPCEEMLSSFCALQVEVER